MKIKLVAILATVLALSLFAPDGLKQKLIGSIRSSIAQAAPMEILTSSPIQKTIFVSKNGSWSSGKYQEWIFLPSQSLTCSDGSTLIHGQWYKLDSNTGIVVLDPGSFYLELIGSQAIVRYENQENNYQFQFQIKSGPSDVMKQITVINPGGFLTCSMHSEPIW